METTDKYVYLGRKLVFKKLKLYCTFKLVYLVYDLIQNLGQHDQPKLAPKDLKFFHPQYIDAFPCLDV